MYCTVSNSFLTFLVVSCYGNQEKLQLDLLVSLLADCTFIQQEVVNKMVQNILMVKH